MLLRCLAFVLLSAAFLTAETAVFRWPSVSPLTRTVHFPDVRTAHFETAIRGVDGKQLYRLQCKHGYSEEPDGFEFMVGFQCRVVQAVNARDIDLLNEVHYGSKPWMDTRGLLDDSGGYGRGCTRYPRVGLRREFRLRGMKLVLQFRNLRTIAAGENKDGEPHRSMTMDVAVTPDASARSAFAQSPPHDAASMKVACKELVPDSQLRELTNAFVEQHGLAGEYPQITPTMRSFSIIQANQHYEFRAAGAKNSGDLRLRIRDASGALAYTFACGHLGVGWTGAWITRCTLTRPGENIDLLASSWDPYGRRPASIIHPEQLYGDCAKYPQFGAVREFRLRGMFIKLEFVNVRFSKPQRMPLGTNMDPPGMISGSVRVTAARDAKATSATAENSRYVDPSLLPKGCAAPTAAE